MYLYTYKIVTSPPNMAHLSTNTNDLALNMVIKHGV